MNSTEEILNRIGDLARTGAIPLETLASLVNTYDSVLVSLATGVPVFVQSLLNEEVHFGGPEVFDVTTLERWPPPVSLPRRGDVYKELKAKGILSRCLSLSAISAIQEKKAPFFRKHYNGRGLIAWASAGLSDKGHLIVPALSIREIFLSDDDPQPTIFWFDLDTPVDQRDLTLLHPQA